MRRFVCVAFASMFLLVPAHAGTFKNPALINTSYDPAGVATADFNHDGNPDIIYVDGTSPSVLHVLLGNGNGTFSHGEDITLPQGVCDSLTCVINLADVTNDGNIDIIVGGSGTSSGLIAVLVGKGNGTFQPPMISTVTNSGSNGGSPSFNTQMGIGDVNGDGALDLIVADPYSASVYVLLGDSTGKFSAGSIMTDYFTGESVAYLFDLNGDGHLDIVVNDRVGAQTYVLLGNGDGTFKPAATYLSFAILLADMNGDGRLDLVASVYPGKIEVLLGNPDGTFASPSVVATVPSTAQLIATGDFNGDGIPDLVFLTPAGIGILPGQGNLAYGSMISSVAGSIPSAFHQTGDITQADFNLDGRNDIAMGVDGGLLLLQGNGDGTFISADSYDVGETVGTLTVADFNGDKLPDIAVTVSATYPRLLLGNGSGQFTLAPDQNQSYGSETPSGSMLTADFTGDGKSDLDVVETTTAYPFGQTFVLFGAGNATFATPVAMAAGPSLVADVNNDGRNDLVSVSGDSILTLLGQTNDTFVQASTNVNGLIFGIAAISDLNHDGKLDLLTLESPSLRVWLGNGDGSFTKSNLVTDSSQGIYSGQTVAVADIDGDRNGDIIVLPTFNPYVSGAYIYIFYGNGDGTFQNAVLLPISHLYSQIVIADVNRDNKPDLVLSDGAGIAVIMNLGGRNFAPEEHFVAGQRISGLSVVDVNGDGFPDIVAANAGGTTVTVLLNQPNGNSVDGLPSNGSFSVSPEPAQYAQPVTLSITMSVASGPVPTGSVSFSVDGSFIATKSLVSGVATYTYGAVLNTGNHTFVATYDGDKTYASESFSTLHVVLPPVYATTTVLVATPKSVYTSQTVSLTATISSSVPVPAGVVTFMDGTNTLGARTIYQGPVVLLDTNLLSAGTHTLTAVYDGYQDPFNQLAIYQPSTSAPVILTVNSTSTTTVLSASTTSPTAGTVVTFTANVAFNSGIPFGGATFYDGSTLLGSSSLQANGSSSYSTAGLSVGAHNITAAFNANATFAGSTSPVVVVTVTSASPGLSPTVVTLAATGNGDQSRLVAKVSAPTGIPAGEMVFLDDGNILGSVATDGSGMALLLVPVLGPGVHSLSASFAGASQFAPNVSPELLEQFPAGGAGFALNVAADSVALLPAGSQPILFSVVPVSGFQQQVQLSCADGVPAGYECSFSPALLYGGNSYLRIQAASQAAKGQTHSGWLLVSTLGIFSSLLIGSLKRRHIYCFLLLVGCLGFTIMTGCGNPPASRQPKMMVLSIRATAGTGKSAIVHSAQIRLAVRSAE